MIDFICNNKKVSFIAFILFLLLLLVLVTSIYKANSAKPSEYIVGFYQSSSEYLPDLYEFSFAEDEFFLKYNGQVITEGTYERHVDNIFICYGENNTLLITLLNNGFYYYDHENEIVVELNKKTNVPSGK